MLEVVSGWHACAADDVPAGHNQEVAAHFVAGAPFDDDLPQVLSSLEDRGVAVVDRFLFLKCGAATSHELKRLHGFGSGSAELVVAAKLQQPVTGGDCLEALKSVVGELCFTERPPATSAAADDSATHDLDARALGGMRLIEAREVLAGLGLGRAAPRKKQELIVVALVDENDDDEDDEENPRARRARRRSSMRGSFEDAPDGGLVTRYLGAVLRSDGRCESVEVRCKALSTQEEAMADQAHGRARLMELRQLCGGSTAVITGGKATYPLERSAGRLHLTWLGEDVCVAFGAPPARLASVTLELDVGRDATKEHEEPNAKKNGRYFDPGELSPMDEFWRIISIERGSISDDEKMVPLEELRRDLHSICQGTSLRRKEEGGWRRSRALDFTDELWPVLLEAALGSEDRARDLIEEVQRLVCSGQVLPEIFEGAPNTAPSRVVRSLRAALKAASASRYGATDAETAAAFAAAASCFLDLRQAGFLASVAELGRESLKRDLAQWLTPKTDGDLAQLVDGVEVALRASSCGASTEQSRKLGREAVDGESSVVRCKLDAGLDPAARFSLGSPDSWELSLAAASATRATALFCDTASRFANPGGANPEPTPKALQRAAAMLAQLEEPTRSQILKCLAGQDVSLEEAGLASSSSPSRPQLILAARRLITTGTEIHT